MSSLYNFPLKMQGANRKIFQTLFRHPDNRLFIERHGIIKKHMAHPCIGFRPCASLVPAGRTHNITHDIMRPFLPAGCSKMTQDLQKGPVSRVEQHEIGGTSEFGNKKTVS